MSGWFGTSNGEVNDPFQGIEAGYRGRRNHQLGRATRGRTQSRGSPQSRGRGNKQVETKANGDVSQKYLGYDLITTYVSALRTYSTTVKQSGLTKKTTKGNSKGQSINAAKNWVDSQVVRKVTPDANNQAAIKQAENRAAQQAAKIVREDTNAATEQAFREASAASSTAQHAAKDPELTTAQKRQRFRQAEQAAALAHKIKTQAQASEQQRFQRAYETQVQNNINQETAKKVSFTEASAQSVVTAMTPQSDPNTIAEQNRFKAAAEAAAAFRPVTMPNDFIAGSYTVRAAFNPTLKNYVVTVFQGTVNKEKKTFSQNEGQAAVSKFNEFKNLATKKAKYDAQESKISTRGGSTVELVVTKSATLSGILDGFLGLFGIGKSEGRRPPGHTFPSNTYEGSPVSNRGPMTPPRVDPSIQNRIARKEKQISQRTQEKPSAVPQNIMSRTQKWGSKIKEFDEVVSKPAVAKTSVVASWASMPVKSFAVKVNGQSTPYSTYPDAVIAYDAAVKSMESAPVVDASIRRRIMEAKSQDGSGGAITDPVAQTAMEKFRKADRASMIPTPSGPDASIIHRIEQAEASATASENYNEMVDAGPVQAEVLPQPWDSDPTYQHLNLDKNEWVIRQQAQRETAVTIDNNNTNLLLGAAALAGAVYLARK